MESCQQLQSSGCVLLRRQWKPGASRVSLCDVLHRASNGTYINDATQCTNGICSVDVPTPDCGSILHDTARDHDDIFRLI